MRHDSQGMFWVETDYKTDKKQNLLTEEGWVTLLSGYWAEQYRLDKGENFKSIAKSLDEAYEIAKASKTGAKREPPEPVWLEPDYLPGLAEAREFNIPLLTDQDLIELSNEVLTTGKLHQFVFDVESFGNFYMVGLVSVTLGKVTWLELSDDYELNCDKLRWIFQNFTMIGFNSHSYDMVINALAVNGCSAPMMKSATSMIIEEGMRGWEVLRQYKAKKIECDHIDLVEVAPLFASLKIYGGRMHAKRMQDLPFDPNTLLSEPQRAIVRWYCVNDLSMTTELYRKLDKELVLRQELGRDYGQDLRSKSDAQIAEAIISSEIEKISGVRPHAPKIEVGTAYHYRIPSFVQFQTPLMQGVLNKIAAANFIVSEHGNIGLPEELKALSINIGEGVYRMGIGGLHSSEKKAGHISTRDYQLIDRDVTSYYPYIILNLGLYPHHLGPNFLVVYRTLVQRRIAAKQQGDKTVADSLKIVINGSFGKLGSKYSVLYSPDLLIQTTITGQLSLLMLIERLELAGVSVVSANTDGLVFKSPVAREHEVDSIVAQWEADTGFETEATPYQSLYSRDVNNYIAVKDPSTWKEGDEVDDRVKTKGIFATPGLSKNPQNQVCSLAVKKLLLDNTPIEETIRSCTDITQFINVRTVKGGAVKLYGEQSEEPPLYLGKAIRWYYAKNESGDIVYAKNGNKVPKSEGAKPLMDLPDTFPTDVDYDWYERETIKTLRGIGYLV